MTTKLVEMAVRDPKTKKLIVDEVEVKGVTVNIRNRDRRSGGHVLNDVMLDEGVYFRPGEVKTLKISEAMVAEIKRHRNGPWELTTAAPTPPPQADDEEDVEAYEPTSSEASAMAAAAEQAEQELLDPPPRVERVPRVRRDRR
jgi:hypothetical protein